MTVSVEIMCPLDLLNSLFLAKENTVFTLKNSISKMYRLEKKKCRDPDHAAPKGAG